MTKTKDSYPKLNVRNSTSAMMPLVADIQKFGPNNRDKARIEKPAELYQRGYLEIASKSKSKLIGIK